MQHPAVFFDRDGVLIETEVRNGKPYAIRDINNLKIDSAALELINKFKDHGYKIIMVTNQPDVGNGHMSKQAVIEIHEKLLAVLPIDLINVCYHSQSAGCSCRKPATGMLTSTATELNLNLACSIMIGDRNSDIAAGNKVGSFTIFIDYGYNEPLVAQPNLKVRSLAEILQHHTEIMEQVKNECSKCE